MEEKSAWLLAGASARGPGHDKRNLPNQDSFCIQKSKDGRIVALVVSDGAGSAAQSEKGSRACSTIMATALLEIGEQHQKQIAGVFQGKQQAKQFIQDSVENGLRKVRLKLDPTEKKLSEFHHTFTGAVLTPDGGFLAHLGDSPAITAKAELIESEKNRQVDFFAESHIHLVEKGEYVNETCFVTQSIWQQNLHIAPVSQGTALLLMSDGAGELVINRGKIFRLFIANLLSNMLKAENRQFRDQLIQEAIADPRADELTADDKTLLIACPREWIRFADFTYVTCGTPEASPPVPVQEEQPETPKPSVAPGGQSKRKQKKQPENNADSPPIYPLRQKQQKYSSKILIVLLVFVFVIGLGLGAWKGQQFAQVVKASKTWLEKWKTPNPPKIPEPLPPKKTNTKPAAEKPVEPVKPSPLEKPEEAAKPVLNEDLPSLTDDHGEENYRPLPPASLEEGAVPPENGKTKEKGDPGSEATATKIEVMVI